MFAMVDFGCMRSSKSSILYQIEVTPHTFTDFIDHLVFDQRAIAFVDRSSFRHVTYRQADRAVWDKLSDHCPVVVEMWVQ